MLLPTTNHYQLSKWYTVLVHVWFHLHYFKFFTLLQLREAQTQIEELETQKSHLQNRLDRIRQARREVLGNSTESGAWIIYTNRSFSLVTHERMIPMREGREQCLAWLCCRTYVHTMICWPMASLPPPDLSPVRTCFLQYASDGLHIIYWPTDCPVVR